MTRHLARWMVCAWCTINAPVAFAFPEGAPPGHSGGGEPHCGQCHWSGDTQPGSALILAGLAGGFEPGKRYRLTLHLTDKEAAVGGFQLALRRPDGTAAGQLSTAGERTVLTRRDDAAWLGHSAPRQRRDHGIAWTFLWRAPESPAGQVLLSIAAVAANDDLSPGGDRVHLLERILSPRPTSSPNAGDDNS